MKVSKSNIHGLLIIDYDKFEDDRGWFAVPYEEMNYMNVIDRKFLQDSESFSTKGTLRGLHFQIGKHAQAKLVRALTGIVFDVVLDIRPASPTFGKAESFMLDSDDAKQLYVPRGCAHGYQVVSDTATFSYKIDNRYSPAHEAGIHWNVKGLKWPYDGKLMRINERDAGWPTFEEWKKQ